MSTGSLADKILGSGNLSLGDSNPLSLGFLLVILALFPLLVLSLTSFIKLSIVFSILRSAIGGGQFPSGAVTALLALVLTLHIMAPVASRCLGQLSQAKITNTDLLSLGRSLAPCAFPLMEFLRNNTRAEERVFFAELTNQRIGSSSALSAPVSSTGGIYGESFFTLVPAFLLSELRSAFAIGFTLFLPFLVIDIVIANILSALGMMMVSPLSVSLPFKVLLFVVTDGWMLLCRALVLSYVA